MGQEISVMYLQIGRKNKKNPRRYEKTLFNFSLPFLNGNNKKRNLATEL